MYPRPSFYTGLSRILTGVHVNTQSHLKRNGFQNIAILRAKQKRVINTIFLPVLACISNHINFVSTTALNYLLARPAKAL